MAPGDIQRTDILHDQSGQFMLIAGFIIAFGMVVTTVMLNNIIFESNIASEAGIDPAKYDIANLIQITRDETRSAYSNATDMVIFNRQVENFNNNLSKTYAMRGEGINITWDNWGGSYAYFTNNGIASGETNWTVIENVANSNITVNVTTGTLYINITNPSTYWKINFISPQIQTINNSQILANVSPPYTISIINGASSTGRFNITGVASGRNFIRARDYVLKTTLTFSTSRMRANITIPVPVPW